MAVVTLAVCSRLPPQAVPRVPTADLAAITEVPREAI